MEIVEQILDEVPQQTLHKVLDPTLSVDMNNYNVNLINSNFYPKEFVQKVDQYFQNPVQRSQAVDINTDVSKVTDLKYNCGYLPPSQVIIKQTYVKVLQLEA